MRWDLEWLPQVDKLARIGVDKLADAPEIPGDLAWVYDAFHALTSSRQIGMGGLSGIPFGAIDRYADRYGVADFERFHRLIRMMDRAYLGWHAKRQERRERGKHG